MKRSIAALAALTVMSTGGAVLAQKPAASAPAKPAAQAPAKPAAQGPAQKPVPVYFYMADKDGHRVLVQSQFPLQNAETESRVLRRLIGIVSGLEQRGFRRDPSIAISDWDKKEKFAKCFIYLEDEESGRGNNTGARVWCSESGISEVSIQPSEDPKHVDRVLERFTFFLNKAKDGLK